MARPVRRLFLDDDPARAEVFLARFPDAIWVETVPDCVAKLAETWDEVHLDHDLGGEHYVDEDRDDCGMEVVRWLTREPRDHLRTARFTVHSHNEMAAFLMVLRLRGAGFQADARPFGAGPPPPDLRTVPTRIRDRILAAWGRMTRPRTEAEPAVEPESVDADD